MVMQPLQNSIENFFKIEGRYLDPFGGEKYTLKVRKNITHMIKEAKIAYSVDLQDIAFFIIGKSVEKVTKDYLLKLKKVGKIKYKIREIESWDFETRINILKKEKFITPNIHSKILSIKWDRNIIGHPSARAEVYQVKRNADANIKLGISIIELIEKKIDRIVY